MIRLPHRVRPRAGQESVWDYPRPPRLERTSRRIRAVAGSVLLADTTRAWRVLETSHPPVYYVPPEDVRTEFLLAGAGSSFCEWKGRATYLDAIVGGLHLRRIAWSYPYPTPPFEPLQDHLAFYLPVLDEGLVDDERARPQPGRFYGGWITSDLVGPFKGEPGSEGW